LIPLVKKIKKLMDDMRVNKPHSDNCSPAGSNEIEKPGSTTDFFYQAIENADGVPFQLIFGPRIGEGYYLNIGSGITDLLGIAPEDFTESQFHSMIEECVPLTDAIPSDPPEARQKFISGELKSYRAELLLKLPSGEKKWIRDASLPLTDDETGRVIGAFGIFYDISDSKNSAINVRMAREKAFEYDRLKSAFLRNISHEIRTPLNAIVGFSTLLGECGNVQQQKEYREIITQNTDHLLGIISDIIELSKLETDIVKINKYNVNINQLLQSVYAEYNERIRDKGILFRLALPPEGEGSLIVTDGYKLKRIIINLVENALKFTESGSIGLGYEHKEDNVEFYINDTGIGISEEQKDSIFTRFYQAESSSSRSFEGSGLGLTISKAYIQLLGGTIWFTSHRGKGSEFRFTVPDVKEEK
jgi:signal transduction histidine kinase